MLIDSGFARINNHRRLPGTCELRVVETALKVLVSRQAAGERNGPLTARTALGKQYGVAVTSARMGTDRGKEEAATIRHDHHQQPLNICY
jgi:hypothetical protein